MASLGFEEKQLFESVFRMSGGYVLDFTDRTFREFVMDAVSIDIDAPEFCELGDSKARRLRAFWKLESDVVVSRLVDRLLDYAGKRGLAAAPEIEQARAISSRLSFSQTGTQSGWLANEDVEEHFGELREVLSEELRSGKPHIVIDRLHTFCAAALKRRLRAVGRSEAELADKPLQSLFGEYRNHARLDQRGKIATRLLRAVAESFEYVNDARNKSSLAHPNPLLPVAEAQLIIDFVAAVFRYLQALDREPRREVISDEP